METTSDRCPIWQTPAIVTNLSIDAKRVDSPRTGGVYVISGTAFVTIGNCTLDQRKLVTSWLVKQRMMGDHEPMITSDLRHHINNRLQVHQRADNLLKYIDSQISEISGIFEFKPDPYLNPNIHDLSWKRFVEMQAWSESMKLEDIQYLLGALENRGRLVQIHSSADVSNFRITLDGHNYIAELSKQTVVNFTQAFVAMWFDPLLKDAWNKGIKPAIIEAGYTPMRIDQEEYLTKIDDQIIAEIRRSKFLVADLTEGSKGARGSVYYEVGFAHGLNIPVIFTCHEDSLDNVHFDVRQYPFIVWKEPEDIKARLSNRISAVIGDGHQKEKP